MDLRGRGRIRGCCVDYLSNSVLEGARRKGNCQSRRNPRRRLEDFHLPHGCRALHPTAPFRHELRSLQPSMHASKVPSLLSARRRHLKLPLSWRRLFNRGWLSSRWPAAQSSPASSPRTARPGFNRHSNDRNEAHNSGRVTKGFLGFGSPENSNLPIGAVRHS